MKLMFVLLRLLGFLKMVLQNLHLEVAERVATAGTERVTYEVAECAVGS